MRVDLNHPDERDPGPAVAVPVSTRLSLNGTIIVGRDIAHAKLKERLDNGGVCRSMLKITRSITPVRQNAGRLRSGSLGPTTAGRSGLVC